MTPEEAKVLAAGERECAAFLLHAVQDGLRQRALGLLGKDLEDPDLGDAYVYRSNNLAIGVIDAGFTSVALNIYETLLKATPPERHTGAMLANTGLAWAYQENLDRAAVPLLQAANEDLRNFGQDPTQSYAMNMLKELFVKRVQKYALGVIRLAKGSAGPNDLESFYDSMSPEHRYAFLAYVYSAKVNQELRKQYRNTFSHMQLFSAVRSLAALLDVRLKQKAIRERAIRKSARAANKTMNPVIEALYGQGIRQQSWWRPDYCPARDRLQPLKESGKYGKMIQEAMKIAKHDGTADFWQSLMLSYFTRQYTAHEADADCWLVLRYYEPVLGHVLRAIMDVGAIP